MGYSGFRAILITSVFILLILFPFVNQQLELIKDVENTENRKPADKPAFDIKHLDKYPAKFEKYYDDHFSMRQRLIKYYNLVNILVFKKSPVPDQVILGKNGWLFMGGNEMDSYKGKHRLEKGELESIRLELEYRKKYLEKRGCKFYLLIGPIKPNIYPEEVPANQYRMNQQSWGEQLTEYLNKNSEVKPVDVYPVLRLHKPEGLLYHKIDNHWNQKGAFLAANEVLRRISMDVPGMDTLSFSDFMVKDSVVYNGNLAAMLSNIRIYNDTLFELQPTGGFKSAGSQEAGYPVVPGYEPYASEYEEVRAIPGSHEPKILIISDSFGKDVFPFLSERFSKSVKIFDVWQYKLNEDIIEHEKPDVVLLLVVETGVKHLLKFQSRSDKK